MIDIDRLVTASRLIKVEGLANTPERKNLIERAIKSIQENRGAAFKNGYIGMKNYAGFGDQEVSCEYGMGPTHGSVVFRIGRASYFDSDAVNFTDDHIYYLECVRDFKGIQLKGEDRASDLDDLIRAYVNAKNVQKRLEDIFQKQNVESYV